MARFQAQTNPVLERELDHIRERMGLKPNQKAALLKELAMLASWLIQQAEQGRTIEAHKGADSEQLVSPVLERIYEQQSSAIRLNAAELQRLRGILDNGFRPTPALQRALMNIADPHRQSPALHWADDDK